MQIRHTNLATRPACTWLFEKVSSSKPDAYKLLVFSYHKLEKNFKRHSNFSMRSKSHWVFQLYGNSCFISFVCRRFQVVDTLYVYHFTLSDLFLRVAEFDQVMHLPCAICMQYGKFWCYIFRYHSLQIRYSRCNGFSCNWIAWSRKISGHRVSLSGQVKASTSKLPAQSCARMA